MLKLMDLWRLLGRKEDPEMQLPLMSLNIIAVVLTLLHLEDNNIVVDDDTFNLT